MICAQRISNPKLFYKKFPKHKTLRPVVTANDFLEHFKTLEGTTLSEEPDPELDDESIFEELDKRIVFEEISKRSEKKTKSLVALT